MSKYEIEPLADQVVVRAARPEETSAGGIILPNSAQENKTEGTVLSVGPGRYAPDTGVLIKPRIEKGDRVVYGKYAGTSVEIDDEELLVIRENDILVKLVECKAEVAV